MKLNQLVFATDGTRGLNRTPAYIVDIERDGDGNPDCIVVETSLLSYHWLKPHQISEDDDADS